MYSYSGIILVRAQPMRDDITMLHCLSLAEPLLVLHMHGIQILYGTVPGHHQMKWWPSSYFCFFYEISLISLSIGDLVISDSAYKWVNLLAHGKYEINFQFSN